MTSGTDLALAARLHSFVDALRGRGLPVSLSERIDAMKAVERTDLSSAAGLHTALSATLVKSGEHLRAFDEIFQLYFRTDSLPAPQDAESDAAHSPPPSAEELADLVRAVLAHGSPDLARAVAELAVARFAAFTPGRRTNGAWYERNVITGLRLDELRAEADANPDVTAERADMITDQIRAVIRELLVGDQGVDAVEQATGTPLLSDVVLARADPEQLREIGKALRLLQRKLATTLMRKRRRRRGPLDLRRTVHASMSTGGVPMTVHYRRPMPTKPDLYVLADLSGSMANFAAFAVSLISGMSDQFTRFRCFAFIENTVEVTEIFRELDDPAEALRAVYQIERLDAARARTDYGRALAQFEAEVGRQLGRRSSVLILGDARGNYRPPGADSLARLADRAGSVHWLNPEPANLWDGGDSRMRTYQEIVTDAVSCRTLGDLRRFIETLD
jgi:uncharacterized protein with von Willebrand factor type A (vWA) domain